MPVLLALVLVLVLAGRVTGQWTEDTSIGPGPAPETYDPTWSYDDLTP